MIKISCTKHLHCATYKEFFMYGFPWESFSKPHPTEAISAHGQKLINFGLRSEPSWTPKTSSFYYATLPGKMMSRSTNAEKSTRCFAVCSYTTWHCSTPITLGPSQCKKKKKFCFFFKTRDLRFRTVRWLALVKENHDRARAPIFF